MSVAQKALLADCQRQLKLLDADLNSQAAALPDLDARLRAEYADAQAAQRIGDAFEIWRAEQATQAAVHWVLGTVFVRFLEDNKLVDPVLAGPGDRGRLAEAAEQAFYASHPTLNERDWLLYVFRRVAALPGGAALFDARHNPVFRWDPTPDAAKSLVHFWRRVDPATGALAHDFADPGWETRFLGDLYQDLSEWARKKYALLQTPVFVEEFILDRTLGEALKVLPLPAVTVIDPACGSGHFLLGAFARLLAAWEAREPGAVREALAQRALDQVAGVDLNPFAVAVARFRLLIAALQACGVTRLDRAPGFHMQVAVGDSLLHGDEPGKFALGDGGRGRYVRHAFADEDLDAVTAILSRRYAVVVGNPPYIAVKDKALNVAYRDRYRTCHMKYGLGVPFLERFWELASRDAAGGVAGWIGQITANAFMKRAFGKKLIQEFFPTVDLTHVVDSSGAYIPGHGTPTVLLFGRARGPTGNAVRAVMGVRGEPKTPLDPSRGLVWSAIEAQIDDPGSESAYITVLDIPRASLSAHPWSIGGGGANEVRALIAAASSRTVGRCAEAIGFASFPGVDDVFLADARSLARQGVPQELIKPLITGDVVRDWMYESPSAAFVPYDDRYEPLEADGSAAWLRRLWPFRTSSKSVVGFNSDAESGDRGSWWTWYRWIPQRYRVPLSIPFAFVSTHNHFVLDRGGVVFKQTAPVIKLPAGTTEDAHLGIVGLLNSSTACFWLKQVGHNRGDSTDSAGARVTGDPAFDTYEFTASTAGAVPIPGEYPTSLAVRLDALAQERQAQLPSLLVTYTSPSRSDLDAAHSRANLCLSLMIALQEELDWCCYRLYGLSDEELTLRDPAGNAVEPPPVQLGERAFEIVLARRMAAGDEEATWFTRHGSRPITEIPAHWPAEYRAVVARRIACIEADRNIALIERPEYKRRWNVEAWETLERDALTSWLLDRLESTTYWPAVALQTTRDLAARAALDPDFAQVATLWAGTDGVALEPVIRELVSGEAVPYLPALRYTDSGREKRRVWEHVWELQRQEDAVDARVAAALSKRDGESDDGLAKRLAAEQKARRATEVGPIPRPPKYQSKDFQRPEFWRMRGALDVPKERFISYPFCARDGDDAPLLGWAGWSHLQQAQALAAWYAERTGQDGWRGERLVPILAGMAELLPWLRQWHNEIDPEFGDRPGEAYVLWLEEELLANGLTRTALDSWEPPRAPRRRGRRGAGASTSARGR